MRNQNRKETLPEYKSFSGFCNHDIILLAIWVHGLIFLRYVEQINDNITKLNFSSLIWNSTRWVRNHARYKVNTISSGGLRGHCFGSKLLEEYIMTV